MPSDSLAETICERFFLALLPPQEMQDYANQVRQYFADHYDSRKAFNSPPHITLQPPFDGPLDPAALASLLTLAQTQPPVEVTLSGFGAFAPDVIFINVLRTFELLALQTAVSIHCAEALAIPDRYPSRPFMPHMTLAFRDLTPENFARAWPEFAAKPLDLSNTNDGNYRFVADRLTLLKHDGQRWHCHQTFALTGKP
jgi:2'-5' RNA ligase